MQVLHFDKPARLLYPSQPISLLLCLTLHFLKMRPTFNSFYICPFHYWLILIDKKASWTYKSQSFFSFDYQKSWPSAGQTFFEFVICTTSFTCLLTYSISVFLFTLIVIIIMLICLFLKYKFLTSLPFNNQFWCFYQNWRSIISKGLIWISDSFTLSLSLSLSLFIYPSLSLSLEN